jgi:hypothetical protein
MSVKPNGLLMFGIVFRNKVSDRVKQRARSKTYKFWITRDESSVSKAA